MDYTPLKKRSKRAQKEYHAAQRGSWNGIKPISRTVPDKKKYDRKKQKQAERRPRLGTMFCLLFLYGKSLLSYHAASFAPDG